MVLPRAWRVACLRGRACGATRCCGCCVNACAALQLVEHAVDFAKLLVLQLAQVHSGAAGSGG